MKKLLLLSFLMLRICTSSAHDTARGESTYSHRTEHSFLNGACFGLITGFLGAFADRKICKNEYPPFFSWAVEPGTRWAVNTMLVKPKSRSEEENKAFARGARIASWASFLLMYGYYSKHSQNRY